MEWLEAALAFAVIMIVLSTMVSVLTETFHRMLRLREDGLTRMVTALYQQVVQPRLADRLQRMDATMDGFVDQVTTTRYEPWSSKLTRFEWLNKLMDFLARFVPGTVNAKKRLRLSTLEFVELFAETPAGQALIEETKQQGEDFKKDFLKDLVNKYEDFGGSASDYFARRARLTSVFVSIVLALALSINVFDLFQTLLTDKGVRDAWIAKGERVTTEWEKSQGETLQALLAQADATAGLSPTEAEALIRANIQELRNATASLQEAQLPLGWERWPWASDEWEKSACGDADEWLGAGCLERANRLFKWLILALLSGLLIGLGGPFWFDIYRKLSALTGITHGLRSATQQPNEPRSEPPAGATTTQTIDNIVIDLFDTSAKGQAMTPPARRSPGPTDGNPGDVNSQ